jgi:hypothetical protein
LSLIWHQVFSALTSKAFTKSLILENSYDKYCK